METRSDVDVLKAIYEAERRADRIVRDAEAEAKALVADAEAASRSDAEARGEELGRRAAESQAARIAEIEREVGAFLRERELETDRWVRSRRARMDGIVDRLLGLVLPP